MWYMVSQVLGKVFADGDNINDLKLEAFVAKVRQK